jgi:hypothetical protein
MPFPDICLEDRENCPNEWPTLFYSQTACSTQEVQLRDRHGEHYNLTDRRVCLIAKEGIDTPLIRVAKEATIKDAPQGIVEIKLNEEETRMPGLFIGEFIIEVLPTDSSGEESSEESEHVCSISSEECSDEAESSAEESPAEDSTAEESSSSWDSSSLEPVVENLCNLEAKLRCYLEIQEDLWHSSHGWHTLTIAELRLAIRDKCREDNFLLDNVEFSDTEIAWALRRPVDFWNEALPPLSNRYTTSTFPFIYHWTDATIGELLVMAATHYERNRLRYTAAGLSIDDKDKAGYYAEQGLKYKGAYAAWVAETKRSINMNSAYGRTSLRSFDN